MHLHPKKYLTALRNVCCILAICCFVSGCQQELPIDGKEEDAEQDIQNREWNRIDTATETHDGVRIVLKFDEVSKSFIGTLENLRGKIIQKVQIGVYVLDQDGNKKKYGPTQPSDLAPSIVKEIAIPTSGEDAFISFTIHPHAN